MMKVVGVIGAGAAGLCAARHISATPGMTPVVWEKSPGVGGTWVFTPHVGKDEYGLPIHSSMYKNLKTNLPKEVMAFPDYPFPSMDESFIHHSDVLKYLESYADHFELRQFIKFGHYVEVVKPVMQDEGPPSWAVTVCDLETKMTSTTTCDALYVCNGHYSVPRIPHVEFIDKFKGRQIHSHDYREPSPYTGSSVVVLGASASGLDISLEVATVAKEVILSHNLPTQVPSELPGNVRQVRGVTAAYDTGFIFGDGSRAEADVIIYCTGYEFTFPFLSEECGVTVEDNIVKPLYKHLLHTTYPSMAFIGLPFQVVPFPLFDIQVQFFLKSLKQEVTLPSKIAMDENTSLAMAEHCNKSQAIRHFHKFGKFQWQYNNDLAHMADIAPLPQVIEDCHEAVSSVRKNQLMLYKSMRFRLTGPDSFERIK